MPVSLTPWFGAVVGGGASTPQSLQSLLVALPAADRPAVGSTGVLRASSIQIQADPTGGAVLYYIMRSDGSATDYGVRLVAAQVWQPPSFESNLYRLDQIYLMADGASARWYVCYVER